MWVELVLNATHTQVSWKSVITFTLEKQRFKFLILCFFSLHPYKHPYRQHDNENLSGPFITAGGLKKEKAKTKLNKKLIGLI